MADTKKKVSGVAEAKSNTSMTTAKKVDTTAAASTTKATVKPEEKAKQTNSVAASKTPAAKTAKRTTKKGAKRGAKPASERTIDLQVQFDGKNDVTYTSLVNNVKEWWKAQGKRETSMKSLNIYVKPEDAMAYCVINDKINYDIDLSQWN